jgi:hypothetical protein
MRYNVFETQSTNGTRDASFASEKSLTLTKRDASRKQVWQGTTLVVENESGDMIAYKKPGERWTDVQF